MATDIGSGPTDINLTTYSGSGVNDGFTKSLSSLQAEGKPILLAFINTYSQLGQAWITKLVGIKNTTFNMFIVMFKYDGSLWSTPNEDFDVTPMVTIAGGNSVFTSIPVVIDNSGGTVSNAFLTGLFSVPTSKKQWTYLIDEEYLISDKWHNESIASTYSISFKHLYIDPDPGDFDGDNPDNAGVYVLKRIENLIADLTIIKSKPINGTIIHTPGDIKRIIFSRPLDGTAVNKNNYTIAGGGVRGSSPIVASNATCSGTDLAENAVALEFNTVTLQDAPNDDVTVTINSTNIKDSSGDDFSATGDNTIDYFADIVPHITPLPNHQVLITDGAGVDTRTTQLEAGGSAPCILNSDRTLNVRILSDNPGTDVPTATLYIPNQPSTPLSFHGLIAEGLDDQADLIETGQYHLHIDQYVDGSSDTLGSADFYFGIVDTATSFVSYADALEGWGYFPREEGIPENCPEGDTVNGTHPDGASTVPKWIGSGLGVISSSPDPGNGNPLKIVSDGINPMDRTYIRDYGCVLKNVVTTNDDWDAPAYIEASLKVTDTNFGNTLTVIDATNSANPISGIEMKTTGAGISLQNGPYMCTLSLVNVTTGSNTGMRLAVEVHSNTSGKRAYTFSAQVVDWTALHTAKIHKEIDGTDRVFKVYLDNAATETITINEKNLLMVDYSDYPGSASVAFGVFEDVNQNVEAVIDFVRYTFYDEKYELGQNGNTLSLGFPNLHRSTILPETNFFQSVDIELKKTTDLDSAFSGNIDPTFQQSNSIDVKVQVIKTVAGNLAGKTIPVKIRFCYADFNDTASQSIDGFKNPTNFPEYGTSEIRPLGETNVSTKVLTISNSSGESDALAWQIVADQTNLTRRLFILAYTDAPLLPTPGLVAGANADDQGYFDSNEDASGRTGDIRGVIRQFLPDFYVRDTPGDDGIQNPGGWLSPDITIGVFAGASNGTHPLPDPQGIGQTLYPAGFARDEDNDIYTPNGYVEIPAQTSGDIIKITDTGWSDYGQQCYYNRVWVRVSNRGIVPGPTNMQVFFLGSTLRAIFDPTVARNNNYEINHAEDPNNPPGSYVQTKFQRYTQNGSNFDVDIIEAIPPLSGASDWNNPREYVIAEHIWHVLEEDVPLDPSDNHGCNAVTINLPNIVGQPDWTSGVDTSPALDTSNSVWAANQLTNNITVRNSNIAEGQLPTTDDVTNKMAIDDNDDPVNYKKLSNNFKPTFSKRHAFWSMMMDTRKMPGSETILRVPVKIAAGARIIGFHETGLPKKASAARVLFPDNILYTKGKYRYFLLKNGKVGTLEGINPTLYQRHFKDSKYDPSVNIYYRLQTSVKPGHYEITISQAANKKIVGGYRTVIFVPRLNDIALIGDERIDAVFDVNKYPEAMHAVPYGKRLPMCGVDVAIRRLYSISPNVLKREVRKIKKGIVNGIKDPDHIIKGLLQHQSGKLLVAVVGRVLGLKGGIPEAEVELCNFDGKTLATGKTDSCGCYLITLIKPESKGAFPLTEWKEGIFILNAYKGFSKNRTLIGTVKRQVDDPFFAMPDMQCKYKTDPFKMRKNI
jgi:hypothetical protein